MPSLIERAVPLVPGPARTSASACRGPASRSRRAQRVARHVRLAVAADSQSCTPAGRPCRCRCRAGSGRTMPSSRRRRRRSRRAPVVPADHDRCAPSRFSAGRPRTPRAIDVEEAVDHQDRQVVDVAADAALAPPVVERRVLQGAAAERRRRRRVRGGPGSSAVEALGPRPRRSGPARPSPGTRLLMPPG